MITRSLAVVMRENSLKLWSGLLDFFQGERIRLQHQPAFGAHLTIRRVFMKSKLLLALALVVVFLASVLAGHILGQKDAAAASTASIVATNAVGISALAQLHVRYLHSTDGAPNLADVTQSYDAVYFVNRHRPEILKTFEVAEVIELQTVALALTRFSIGGKIYRTPIWFTKRDGRWFISIRQYVEYFSEDLLKNEDPNKAKDVIEKAQAWKKESADLWFW